MATDLQLMYLAERAGGRSSHATAVATIAAKIGVDDATVSRCLHRARRADEAETKGGATA